MAESLLTSADPEPPRRSFVLDDCGVMWWRTDSDGVDGRSANWCTLERGCASGSDFHDHESWTKIAGTYGPVRLVEGSLDHIRGFLARPDMPPQLTELVEQAGAAQTFARLAAASRDGDADGVPAPRAKVYVDALGWRVQDIGASLPVGRVWPFWDEAFEFADLHVRLRRRRWHARGCTTCRGRGVVPDWSAWGAESGEPRPKPCAACQPDADPDPVHRAPVGHPPQLAQEVDDLYAAHPGMPDGPLFPEGEAGAWLLRRITDPAPHQRPPRADAVPASERECGQVQTPDDPDQCRHARECLNAFPLRGWLFNFRRFGCPECEREAHEAWVEEVRTRFESALKAIAHGWGYTWGTPGVYVRPDLPPDGWVKTYADGTVSVSLDGGLP